MKACFMGLGYIGLPTAIIAAKHGVQVIGVDINPKVVELTNQGKLHIIEPGMEEMLQDGSMITGPADSKYIGVEITDINGKKTYQPGEPDYTLISNAVLKVLWESTAPPVPITRTVTFKDEDTVLFTQTVESGNKADKPDDPTKDGYTFDGWYEDADFTTAFIHEVA